MVVGDQQSIAPSEEGVNIEIGRHPSYLQGSKLSAVAGGELDDSTYLDELAGTPTINNITIDDDGNSLCSAERAATAGFFTGQCRNKNRTTTSSRRKQILATAAIFAVLLIVALAAGFGINKKNQSDTNNNINSLSSATDGGEVVSSSMVAALGDSPTSAPTPRGTVKSVSNDFALVEGEDSDDDGN